MRDSESPKPSQTPAEIRIKAVERLSFLEFTDLTRHYAEIITKYVPDAAGWIESAAAPWHERWDAIVLPNGKYVGIDQASALRQFDVLKRFGAEVCDGIHLYYDQDTVNEIKEALEDGVRKNRQLYLNRYEELERLFSDFADSMINILIDVLNGSKSKSDAVVEITQLVDLYTPKKP